MTDPTLPPRKDVTAFSAEVCYEDDPPFVVLTLHHGLGKMTRVDLDPDDVVSLNLNANMPDLVSVLTAAAEEART